MNISNAAHAGAKGVSDFLTSDELYMNTTFNSEGNDVFLTGDSEDGTWAVGSGPGADVHAGRHLHAGMDAQLR